MIARILSAPAALALALAALPARAALIAVYTAPGEPLALEAMIAFARALKANPEARDARFAARVSDASALTSGHSVPPRVSAYFWSDAPVDADSGYRMEGETAWHVTELAAEAPASARLEPAKAWSSALREASLRGGSLEVAYSLSAPGTVTLEAFAPTGRRLGAWRWHENRPGLFERSLTAPRAAPGAMMLRWTAGGTRAERKVFVPASRR